MVSEYKTGNKGPSLPAAIALADYAQMCVEYLLTGKGPQRPWGGVDAEFQKLVQAWETLDDPHRLKLLEQAELLLSHQEKQRRPRYAPQTGDTSTKLPALKSKKPSH
jgi:hypothetical protein